MKRIALIILFALFCGYGCEQSKVVVIEESKKTLNEMAEEKLLLDKANKHPEKLTDLERKKLEIIFSPYKPGERSPKELE